MASNSVNVQAIPDAVAGALYSTNSTESAAAASCLQHPQDNQVMVKAGQSIVSLSVHPHKH